MWIWWEGWEFYGWLGQITMGLSGLWGELGFLFSWRAGQWLDDDIFLLPPGLNASSRYLGR